MAKYDEIIDITKILTDYSEDIQDGITKSAIEIATQGAKELKATSPVSKIRSKNRGRYAKGWKVDKRSGKGYVHTTIYNSTDWQLTHLLEKPHVIRNKYGQYDNSKPIVHIAPVEDKCINEFNKSVEQIVKNGG